MKAKGFTLIELLIALLIVAIAFTTLLTLHSWSIKRLRRCEKGFLALQKLELFLEGEPILGIQTTKQAIHIQNAVVIQETYKVKDIPWFYFKIWKVKKF